MDVTSPLEEALNVSENKVEAIVSIFSTTVPDEESLWPDVRVGKEGLSLQKKPKKKTGCGASYRECVMELR